MREGEWLLVDLVGLVADRRGCGVSRGRRAAETVFN